MFTLVTLYTFLFPPISNDYRMIGRIVVLYFVLQDFKLSLISKNEAVIQIALMTLILGPKATGHDQWSLTTGTLINVPLLMSYFQWTYAKELRTKKNDLVLAGLPAQSNESLGIKV